VNSPLAQPSVAAVQAAAFAVEGHPIAAVNGTYRLQGLHEGWPHFENEQGEHLYRCQPRKQWFMYAAFMPDSGVCNGVIDATEGPIPTGAQRWRCVVKAAWEERTVTVSVLVGAPGSLRFVLARCTRACERIFAETCPCAFDLAGHRGGGGRA
jgi:hypothetical protein